MNYELGAEMKLFFLGKCINWVKVFRQATSTGVGP